MRPVTLPINCHDCSCLLLITAVYAKHSSLPPSMLPALRTQYVFCSSITKVPNNSADFWVLCGRREIQFLILAPICLLGVQAHVGAGQEVESTR